MRYLILLLLVATSCTPLYLPGTRNTPLFREQGEAQIGGYLSAAGVEGHGAYALTDHVGVIGSYSYASSKRTDPVEYTRKNSMWELGLGYFDRSRSTRYEVYAGYGAGQGTNYDAYYFFTPPLQEFITDVKYTRIFLQPSIGTNKRNVNVAFTPRFSWVDFTEFTASSSTTPTVTQNAKPNEDPIIYIEPAFTTKFRLKGNLHGFLQLGIAFPIGDTYYTYQTLQAAMGIQIDTGGLRTKVY